MSWNLGSAVLIIGSIYLHLVHGLGGVITWFLCIVGLATWAYIGFNDERKGLFKAKIRMLEAKTKYYLAKERELKQQ